MAFLCMALIGLMSQSFAYGQPTIAETRIHSYGNWDLVEIKDNTGDVMGFWAVPVIAVDVGNIRRLWFESIPGNDWNVWAFEPVTIYDKMDSLIANGASDDSIDILLYRESTAADSGTNLSVDGGANGLMVKGFIAGDPLTEAAGSLSDPNAMIDLLANIGYPVAPGMTGLMVDGTAGASVGMNQATKQSLDCLRLTGGSECSPCSCSRMGGSIQSTPWSVSSQWVDSNTRLKCTYTRTETHTYWKAGLDPDTCLDCTAGSEDEPLVNTFEREVIRYWMDLGTCPPQP